MSKTYFSKRSDMYHYAASADYNGEYIRSANYHINGGDVWSYTTKVAMFDKNKEMLCKDCVVKCQNGFDYVLVKKKKDGWLAFPILQLNAQPILRTYTTIKESEMIMGEER